MDDSSIQKINYIENKFENKIYHINFFKFLYLYMTKCCSNDSKKYFKYYDLREEIISEDFIYKLFSK